MAIKLEEFKQLLSLNVLYGSCLEINFAIEADEIYRNCWLGKMQDPKNYEKELYWFGLVEDGSQAYEYYTLDELLEAKVFHGKSLLQLWDKIEWISIEGSPVEKMLTYYLGL